jgi:hypothetical protein
MKILYCIEDIVDIDLIRIKEVSGRVDYKNLKEILQNIIDIINEDAP